MWAGSIVVRVGRERSALVAIRADSDGSLQRLRTLFAAWLDDDFASEVLERTPAFSVHLTPQLPGGRGPRSIPHLRRGSMVVARSRDADEVLHALTCVIGGIHHGPPPAGRARVWLRAFTRGERLVLVDAQSPHLIDDRELAAAGVSEAIAWGVEVGPDGRALIPQPMPDLDRAPIGPGTSSGFLQLEAVLSLQADTGRAHLVGALAAHSGEAVWFELVHSLAERGRVRSFADRNGLRIAIREMLEA